MAAASFGPFEARRIASVATASIRLTPMASAMARNRRTASTARRKWSGAIAPVSASPSARRAERFFIEARHRRAAKLIVDHEPDRVRADVDDRVRASVGLSRALGVKLKRPRRLFRRVNPSIRHRAVSASRFIIGERRRPADGSSSSPIQTATGAPVRTERSAAWQSLSDKRLPRAEFSGSRSVLDRAQEFAHRAGEAVVEPGAAQAAGRATPASVYSSTA